MAESHGLGSEGIAACQNLGSHREGSGYGSSDDLDQ